MRFPDWLRVYGSLDYRGPCPREETEQINFFSHLLHDYPEIAAISVHPKNEGKRDFMRIHMDRKQGALTVGASDIIIPGCPALVMEMKRKDHTRSQWKKGQREYLQAAQDRGAFCCVALGWEAAMEAVREWLQVCEKANTIGLHDNR